MIRAPICAVVGHVDHGKTTLLDTIRGSAVALREEGKITQAIGASIISIEHIKKIASNMLAGKKITVPGLLFIDTPGHAAFTGMRKRGGALADIAILIVDINEGFKPQTTEALEILRKYKTPFIIVANKIDLAPGYRKKDADILKDWTLQEPRTQEYLETKLYELVGKLSEFGLPSERFDRIEGFDKQIAIVPMSAVTGHGLDKLLAILVGLAQRFLENNLSANVNGPAKGTVLEVSEDKGLGTTLNAIIYDGTLRTGDKITLLTQNGIITTKVRALFQPSSLTDLRDSKTKFVPVQEAVAATGVKISAPMLEGVTAGTNLYGGDEQKARKEIAKEQEHIIIQTDPQGVVLKADNIGSLEAVINLLREKNIPVRIAEIGSVSKKDVAQAQSHEDPYKAILAFNVKTEVEIPEDVKLISAGVIYKLVDDYELYKKECEQKAIQEELKGIKIPGKFRVLSGCIFRQSNPLICGVEVLLGEVHKLSPIVNEKDPHNIIGVIKEIQDKKESIEKAIRNQQVAISLPGLTGGRQIKEEDVLWSVIKEEEFIKLKKHSKQLTEEQKQALREFAEVMRKQKPMWGV